MALTQRVSALDKFMINQPSDKVKYAQTAVSRKIFGSQKLTQIDKQILYLHIGKVLLTNTALGLTVLFINRTKLRQFSGLKWGFAGAGLYVIWKAIYDVPKRMAFADFIAEDEKPDTDKPSI